MDIGIVHPELIYPRGAEKQVCKLSYHLNKMGHEITIYTFEKKNNYLFDPLLKNIDVISLNKKWAVNLLFGANDLRWIHLIRKISSKIKTHDIINVHNHPARWISRYTRIPVLWPCNEPYRHNLSKNLEIMYYFHNKIDQNLSSNVSLVLSNSKNMKENS